MAKTKCLDREDIESLGWIYQEDYNPLGKFMYDHYTRDNLHLFKTGDSDIEIRTWGRGKQYFYDYHLFYGKCPTINELKIIHKLCL